MKKKLSPADARVLMQEDDESPHEQILMERRQTKAWKKDLSTRPEKRWVEPKKKTWS